MTMCPLKIFVIAGEVSGDILGGAIVRAVDMQTDRPLEVCGIGDGHLISAGLKKSLFPMHDLAVMGVAEIVPKICFFVQAINKTVRAAESFSPDVILSIDAPDFSFRVEKKINARGKLKNTKLIHVVAPSVWAWRPKRAKKIAMFLDGLVCFFPFEPPYFTRYGLDAISIGHPAIDAPLRTADARVFRDAHAIASGTKLVGLYMGSRAGVIDRHADIFVDAVNMIVQKYPDIHVVIPTFSRYESFIREKAARLTVPFHVVTDDETKPNAMRACNVALAVSGTVGLELAIADVPHAVGYKMSRLTFLIVRLLIKTPFAHLANIILSRSVVPEYIQDACTPENLSVAVDKLLRDDAAQDAQKQSFHDVRVSIGEGAVQSPADMAATFILNKI